MTPYRWRGQDCLIVAPLIPNSCTGCLFHMGQCPHTDHDTDVVCGFENDVLFIEDTPEALAEYTAKKLEGA